MSFGRSYASILLIVFALFVGGSSLHGQSSSPPAQPSNGGLGLIVPVTGVADVGSLFSGALLIQNFAVQGSNIVATGIVNGALMGIGTFRNLVMQVTLPLDLAASRAGMNTDAAVAQSSCEVLHVELGATSVNVLGSTMGLNPVAFDIAAPVQTAGAGSPVPTPTSPVPTAPTPTAPTPTSPIPTTTPDATASTSPGGAQPGTVTPSLSANATQAPTSQQAQPGAPAAKTPATPTAQTPTAQTPLASQLCSVNGFRDASSPAKVAQQLNGILAALGGTQSSQ